MVMKHNFVIVEDDEQIAWIMTEQLREERPGSIVHTFFDPFSALEHLRLHPVNLLITDLHMSGMNGFDLLHRTRQFAPELPVIMITADLSTEVRRTAAHYGVQEYLAKPFDVDNLLATVGRLLAEPEPAPAASLDWQGLLSVAGLPQRDALEPAPVEMAEVGLHGNGEVMPAARLNGAAPAVAHTRQPAAHSPVHNGSSSHAFPDDQDLQAELGFEIIPLKQDAASQRSGPSKPLAKPPSGAESNAHVSLNGSAVALDGQTNSLVETRYFPHDALCRRFSRHLEALHWCALIDFETRSVLGLYEAPPERPAGVPAAPVEETDLIALAEGLLWPPLLSKLGLQASARGAGRAAQEVQLVFPDCVLLAKALDEDKFALVLQSGNLQLLPKLWEQVRTGLVVEGLVVEDVEPEPWPWPDAMEGNLLADGPVHSASTEFPAELLAHFYPKEVLELQEQPLQFSEPGRSTQALRLEPPQPSPAPAAAAPPFDPAEQRRTTSGLVPQPPWPGRTTAAELVTPLWMAEVLSSEIGPYEPQLRTDLIKSKPGVWLYQRGRYCLRTSINHRYPDRASAEAAIQVCLRDHLALGELHAGDTFFVLSPDTEGQYWLWTVSAWLTTLEAELTQSLQQQDEVALAAALCKFAEAILCSLQLALESRLLLTVEPANFATIYEGGPLVYVADEIEHGYCLSNIGQTILSRAEEFAAWPQAVSVYLDVLGVGVCSRFKREQVRQLDLLRSLRDVSASTQDLQNAQARLIDRIRRCPE